MFNSLWPYGLNPAGISQARILEWVVFPSPWNLPDSGIEPTSLTSAKTWKQPKCPTTEEWIKIWYLYTMEYCFEKEHMKKNEIMPFAATCMDLESVISIEVSQRRRNIKWHPLCEESKKTGYKWTYLKSRKRLTDLVNLRLLGGGWWEGIVREFGRDMCTLLYLKRITNKDHCTQGSLLNVIWQSGCERSLAENGYMYMYGWIPSLSTWNCHC